MVNKKSIKYLVHFLSRDSIYQIYAKHVSQSDLFGFIEVEDLIFGKAGAVVVDPSEDKLRKEFEGVKRFYIPMNAVLRIDAVEKEGVAKIVDSKGVSNISPFQLHIPKDK